MIKILKLAFLISALCCFSFSIGYLRGYFRGRSRAQFQSIIPSYDPRNQIWR